MIRERESLRERRDSRDLSVLCRDVLGFGAEEDEGVNVAGLRVPVGIHTLVLGL